ncbi:MAG: zinc ribbon domain-containing protein [Candidatus Altiarchaeota archaeon]
MAFCTECGAKISDEATFCTECGSKVESVQPTHHPQGQIPASPPTSTQFQELPPSPQPTPQPTLKQKKKSRKWLWVGAFLVVVIVIVTGIGLVGVGGMLWFMSSDEGGFSESGGEISFLADDFRTEGKLSNVAEQFDYEPHDGSFDYGTFSSSDSKKSLKFHRLALEDNLFLDRTVDYTRQAGGDYTGEVTLTFSAPSGEKKLEYVEEVPKSFAEHIDKLSFSVQPNEIVDPDPKFKFNRKIDGTFSVSVITTEGEDPTEIQKNLNQYAGTAGADYCQTLVGASDKRDCITSMARLAGNTDVCDKITGKEAADQCYGQIAVDKKDPKVCNNLNDDAELDCLTAVSVATGDKKICDQIYDAAFMDPYNDCLAQIAVKNNNPDDCTKIEDPIMKDQCLRQIAHKSRSVDDCMKITIDPRFRDLCLEEVAIRDGNKDICEKIADAEMKKLCYLNIARDNADKDACEHLKDNKDAYEVCIMGVAEGGGGKDVCKDITNEALRDMCYAKVAMKGLDKSVCDEIKDFNARQACSAEISILSGRFDCDGLEQQKYREDCLKAKAAFEAGDVELCKQLKSQELRDLCLGKVAGKVGDINACDDIKNPALKEKCQSAIAARNGDLKVCDEITYLREREKCIAGIAAVRGDAALCDKLTFKELRDKCFFSVARAKKDKSLCNKIADELLANNCRDFMDEGEDGGDKLPGLPGTGGEGSGDYPCTLCSDICSRNVEAWYNEVPNPDYKSPFTLLRCTCGGEWSIQKTKYTDPNDAKASFGDGLWSTKEMIRKDKDYFLLSESENALFYFSDFTDDIGMPGKTVGPNPVTLNGKEYSANTYATYKGYYKDTDQMEANLSGLKACAAKLTVQEPRKEGREEVDTACDFCADIGWKEVPGPPGEWQRNNIDYTDVGKYWSLSCHMGGENTKESSAIQITTYDDQAKAEWKIKDMVGRKKAEVYQYPDSKKPVQALSEGDTIIVTLTDYTQQVNKPAGRMNWGVDGMMIQGNTIIFYTGKYIEKHDALNTQIKAEQCAKLLASKSKPKEE